MCPARAPPPQGSQFFRFDIQNFWNVTASGVHTPSYEVHAPPPTGNPGSATAEVYINSKDDVMVAGADVSVTNGVVHKIN